MKSLLRLVSCAVVALVSFAASAVTLTIIPAAPRSLEPVYVRISPEGTNIPGVNIANTGVIAGQVEGMAGAVISVNYATLISFGGKKPGDVFLGRLPAGTYFVTARGFLGESTAQFTVTSPPPMPGYQTTEFEPIPNYAPSVNYSDHWWNPAQSGWGLSIVQGPTGLIFATWFDYDAVGSPTWYTLQPGSWTQSTRGPRYYGPIVRTSGPPSGGAFDPTLVSETTVGSGWLDFEGRFDSGVFQYTIGGVSKFRFIQRLPIE